MAIASNGAAIIGGVVVPATEVRVLATLTKFRKAVTVPEIAKLMDHSISDASLYSLLGRLDEKRRLVARQVVEVEVHGTKLRRVTWLAHQSAMTFFEESLIDFQKEAPFEPAGNPGRPD